jgi:hypothetical protein
VSLANNVIVISKPCVNESIDQQLPFGLCLLRSFAWNIYLHYSHGWSRPTEHYLKATLYLLSHFFMVGGDPHCQALSDPSSWEKTTSIGFWVVGDTILSCTLDPLAFSNVELCCNPDRIPEYCQLLQAPLINALHSRKPRTSGSGLPP